MSGHTREPFAEWAARKEQEVRDAERVRDTAPDLLAAARLALDEMQHACHARDVLEAAVARAEGRQAKA